MSEAAAFKSLTGAKKLEYENAVMKRAIAAFCEGQEWACDEWKQQTHVAPLFKLANDQPKDMTTIEKIRNEILAAKSDE